MTVLASGIRYVDVRFQGVPGVIATAVLDGPDGLALVDPGPSSSLPELERAIGRLGHTLDRVRTILLTHIHLDHAGATGTLLARCPGAVAFVHERGAPHVIDPTKLLSSATRLYGDEMDRLWGAVDPAPADRVRPLAGGERIEAAGRTFEVAATPGHASHHVSYYDPSSRIAFVGDTAGAKLGNRPFVMAPTPPPDIDLEAWSASLDRISAWMPATLFLTHFGPVHTPETHVRELRARLEEFAAAARRILESGGTEEEQAATFATMVRRSMRQVLSAEDADRYQKAVPVEHCWLGLARYWRKRTSL